MERAVIRVDEAWWEFTDPTEVLVATCIEEVLPQLQQAAASGCYAVGYVAYEAAGAFDAALKTHASKDLPCLYFALFDAPIIHEVLPPSDQSWQIASLEAQQDESTFMTDIAAIKEQIAQGATYQVNYTYPLKGKFKGDSYALFTSLMEAQDAPHAAYIQTQDWSIVSASLELFFTLKGGMLTSRPMKGTAARGMYETLDLKQAAALGASEKNRAENIMIVDMIRNDMGRIAEPGTVQTIETYALERYATLWQMTSTIQSRVSCGVVDVFRALFPCASITGAPKVKTMELIHALERQPRSVYTGSVGYITPQGDASFNVAIRTALIQQANASLTYGVGSGIIWDSDPILEYAETQIKATLLTTPEPSFSLLESFLWVPQEGCMLEEMHMERMARSAAYFDIDFNQTEAHGLLDQVTGELPLKVRLLLHKNGKLDVESAPLRSLSSASVLQVKLAGEPVNPADRFLYHKTTHRQVYAAAEAERVDCDEVILWNLRGEVTEGTIFNVAVEREGVWVTPPVASGLLGGVMRAKLLEQGALVEGVISVEELQNASSVRLFNSVRGICDAVWCDRSSL
jgi:para-aminobenzoate synthetase/4-amino-4-deoxychorismate lyase